MCIVTKCSETFVAFSIVCMSASSPPMIDPLGYGRAIGFRQAGFFRTDHTAALLPTMKLSMQEGFVLRLFLLSRQHKRLAW